MEIRNLEVQYSNVEITIMEYVEMMQYAEKADWIILKLEDGPITYKLIRDVDNETIHALFTEADDCDVVYGDVTPAFREWLEENFKEDEDMYNYAKAINMIFGNGSGEEFAEYMRQNDITEEDVKTVIATLAKLG
jgi:hypothetical protein